MDGNDNQEKAGLWKILLPIFVALLMQGMVALWWVRGFTGDVQRSQEITSLKLTMLESRLTDWYSKGDAARDFALRDEINNELRRRVNELERKR